jgi:hypothetical protein
LPKEPVSATLRRVLVVPSCLEGERREEVRLMMRERDLSDAEMAVDSLRIDHGIGSLDAVLADVAFFVGDVVEDERRHGDGRGERE